MIKDNLRIFNDAEETAASFGDYLMKRLHESKEYHIALSGGSTPKLLFKYLAEKYKDHTGWSKLHVYWGDERCVPPDDDESNFKMTNDLLLKKISIPEHNIHRILGEENPEEEANRYGEELMQNMSVASGRPVFDLVILGMGDDGHTASIFPHQIELLESHKICAVATHPDSGQRRVTLTGPVINSAKEVVFLVTGAGKKERIVEIFQKKGAWETYPATYIHPTSGDILWYVDKKAVSDLEDLTS